MDNPEAALKDADIVKTATRSNTTVLDGNLTRRLAQQRFTRDDE